MRTAIIVAATALATLAAVVALQVTTSLTGETKVVTVTVNDRPSGSVARVVDEVVSGSLLRLEGGETLRLRDLDSPEPGVECYGDESRRALELLAPPGATAWVLPDSTSRQQSGEYSSAFVVVNGRFINVDLAREGAAAPYLPEGQDSFSNAILAAAKEAYNQDLGMWGSCPHARLNPNEPIRTGPG